MKKIVAIIMIAMAAVSVSVAQTDGTESTDSTVAQTVQCAQSGNDVCQTLLGKWIFEGSHGYKQDHEKAVAWWMQAAKQNNSEATANLGFCYQFGWGIEADSTTAVRLFEKALKQGNTKLLAIHDSLARNGSVFSAMMLARFNKMAIGMSRDEALALKYYQMAAKRGNVEAMREAGILMRTTKEDAGALAMFKQAMQKGDVTSTYYYGKMLCEGRGTATDAKTGIDYIRQAAEKDYAAAQYELEEAYVKGIGIEKDEALALWWYQKAALGGNRAAWWQLAECYREGRGTAVDYEKSLEYYAKAYEVGYHNKLKALLTEEDSEWNGTQFMCYLRGMRLLEVDANPNAAIKEFSKLPKQIAIRQTMESICLMHPSYSKRNVKKAVKQLTNLAETDHRAAYELAMLQMKGDGMPKDVAKAEKCLKALADAGYSRAINTLADCYYEGVGLNREKKKAFLLYLQAEKLGSLSAIGASRLAMAFRDGDGMKVNTARADELEKYRVTDVKTLLEKVNVK